MTVVITAPAPSEAVSGTVPVSATYDGKGFTLATLVVDGVQRGSSDTAKPIVFTLDTTELADGNRVLVVNVMYRRITGDYRWQHSAPVTVGVTNVPPPPPEDTWTTIVDDQFDTPGLPAHWMTYNFAGIHGTYYLPSHVIVAGDGKLVLRNSWDASGPVGAGWYQGSIAIQRALRIEPWVHRDQRITTRIRIVSVNGVLSHRNLPLRWPTTGTTDGEEDLFENDGSLTGWNQFLHWGVSPSVGTLSHAHVPVDMSQWHVLRFQRVGQEFTTWIDGVLTMQYTATTLQAPPTGGRTCVFQQERQATGVPPVDQTGYEDIEIDYVTIENPV